MIQIICKVAVLVVNDVTPRLRLTKGKVHTMAPAMFHRSKKLQAALIRGDVALVGAKGAGRRAPSPSAAPTPLRLNRKQKRALAKKAPTVDVGEVDKVVSELKDVHNLFVHLAGEIQGRPAPEAGQSTLDLLVGLKESVEGLAGRLDQIETRITTSPVTAVAPQRRKNTPALREDRTPIFIPSEIRTSRATDMKLDVESKTEDSTLDDAEAALRSMRKPKPRKKKRSK